MEPTWTDGPEKHDHIAGGDGQHPSQAGLPSVPRADSVLDGKGISKKCVGNNITLNDDATGNGLALKKEAIEDMTRYKLASNSPGGNSYNLLQNGAYQNVVNNHGTSESNSRVNIAVRETERNGDELHESWTRIVAESSIPSALPMSSTPSDVVVLSECKKILSCSSEDRGIRSSLSASSTTLECLDPAAETSYFRPEIVDCFSVNDYFDPAIIAPSNDAFKAVMSDSLRGVAFCDDFQQSDLEGRDKTENFGGGRGIDAQKDVDYACFVSSTSQLISSDDDNDQSVSVPNCVVRVIEPIDESEDIVASDELERQRSKSTQGFIDIRKDRCVGKIVPTLNGISYSLLKTGISATGVKNVETSAETTSENSFKTVEDIDSSSVSGSLDRAEKNDNRPLRFGEKFVGSHIARDGYVLVGSQLKPSDVDLTNDDSDAPIIIIDDEMDSLPFPNGGSSGRRDDESKVGNAPTGGVSDNPLAAASKPSLAKPPRAKKSCISSHAKASEQPQHVADASHPSPKVVEQTRSSYVVESSVKTEELVDATTVVSSRVAATGMFQRIRLPELENVLGIGYKSLDKLDAKTLDSIVFAKGQKNSKSKTDGNASESVKPEITDCKSYDGVTSSGGGIPGNRKGHTSSDDGNFSGGKTGFLDGDGAARKAPSQNTWQQHVRNCDSPTLNARIDDRSPLQRGGSSDRHDFMKANRHLGDPSSQHSPSLNKLVTVQTEERGGGGVDKSRSKNTPPPPPSINLVVTAETSASRTTTTLTLANGMVFKARKSQTISFGRTKRCRDILPKPFGLDSKNSLGLSSGAGATDGAKASDSGVKSSATLPSNAHTMQRSAGMTSLPSSIGFTSNNKARKQASSFHGDHQMSRSHKDMLPPSSMKSSNITPSENFESKDAGTVRNQIRKRKPDDTSPSKHFPDELKPPNKKKRLTQTIGECDSFTAPSSKRPLKSSSRSKSELRRMSQDADRLETASVSSASSSVDNFSVKLPRRLASSDKTNYPVTPPRSPENVTAASDDFTLNTDLSDYLTPVCCCRMPGLALNHIKFCQALDSVDGKVIGCSNRVVNPEMFRPSVAVAFMALCENHRRRLHDHRCCPGCGLFCIQGEFYECKRSGDGTVHDYHRDCQVFLNNKYFCPHCGEESLNDGAVRQATEPRSASFVTINGNVADITNSRCGKKARMFSVARRKNWRTEGSVISTSNSVNSMASRTSHPDDSLLLGMDKKDLQTALAALSGERLMKVRPCAKSLYNACKAGEYERVLYMIAENIDPNLVPEDYNETGLHVASRGGHREIVNLLLQAGALANSVDRNLRTPLMEAAVGGHVSVLEILVKAGAVFDARASDGMTVLHLAAKSGRLDALRFLINSRQLDINVKDDGGWTPVIWAAEHKHLNTVRYLLKIGADPNIMDNELNTGLHWAAYAGSTDIAEHFLNAGCDLECANEHGDRPLHIAARQNNIDCVSLFLLRGASVEVLNKSESTPLDCCSENESRTKMMLLLSKHLQKIASARPQQPERLVHRDLSLGRESHPVTVVNGIDRASYPDDFVYVSDYVETIPININRVITSLRSCRCKDECSDTSCNCVFNSIKCWFDKEGHLLSEFNYAEPPMIFECNKACHCFANCQNRVVQLGITCRLQVFRTNGRGWGCRTLLDIARGTFVCEYIGELIPDAEADRREDDSYLFDLDNQETDTFCVDAAKYGNVSRFINHLCEPNLIPVKVYVDHQDLRFPRMCFFANRDIKANEELGFDYGDKFWVIKWKHFTCSCGSIRCRYSDETIEKTLEEYERRQAENLEHAGNT